MTGQRLVVFGCRKTASPVLGDEGARQDAGLPDMEYKELPCLGALDPLMPLRELDGGADMVLGVGCYVSRCEHVSGSQRAKAAIERVGNVLEQVGVDRSKVGLVLGSPIDPAGLFDAINEFISGDGGEDE
jgi:F420-non-reducing hydrogenase iron-sulfur subunit